jgi:cytochrome P450
MAPIVRPPGPKNRGIVGNLPMASGDPLGVFTQWARQYGDVFYYRIFHRHIYFLNHPDLVKDVLVTNHQNFIKGEAVRFNRRIFGNGLITNEGSSWLQQRRLIQPAFHRERIESYANTMVAYAERMIATWRDGEERDIHRDMMHLTLEIVTKTLFNVEIAGERDRIAVALNTLMQLSSGARMLLPPLLRLTPTPGNLRYLQAARRLDDIVYALIRERRASGKVHGASGKIIDDLLSTLLEARDETGASMPDKQLRDEVMTILLAGHETTAVSLSWTWYLLAQNPEVEQKLCAELRQVLNGRSPTPGDLPELRYTERVIKEAMRLYPPVWTLVRNPIKDCEIGGYRVLAGASVIMSPWVMHRDPQHYDEPERFNPDRWLDERTIGASKFTYFPFGGGPRSCIGSTFAMMEAVLVLATITQRYKIGVLQDPPVEPLPTITLRPKHGVRALLTRRES